MKAVAAKSKLSDKEKEAFAIWRALEEDGLRMGRAGIVRRRSSQHLAVLFSRLLGLFADTKANTSINPKTAIFELFHFDCGICSPRTIRDRRMSVSTGQGLKKLCNRMQVS